MKTRGILAIVVCGVLAVACDDNTALPDTGYIRAKINGIETIYSGPVDSNVMNYMGAHELGVTFQQGDNQYLTWSIDIRGVDLKNVEFPFVIMGPKEADMDEPAFWCNILDSTPGNSAYGKGLAGTTSLYWNTKLTLVSIEENVVKGTFEGEGVGEGEPQIFTDGEFLARLK